MRPEASKPHSDPEELSMHLAEQQVSSTLAADSPRMPDDVLSRLLASIAIEANARAAIRPGRGSHPKPGGANPPTHYDKQGLGMRDTAHSPFSPRT